jgi:hypothetical protein
MKTMTMYKLYEHPRHSSIKKKSTTPDSTLLKLFFIPFGKLLKTLSKRNLRRKPKIPF